MRSTLSLSLLLLAFTLTIASANIAASNKREVIKVNNNDNEAQKKDTVKNADLEEEIKRSLRNLVTLAANKKKSTSSNDADVKVKEERTVTKKETTNNDAEASKKDEADQDKSKRELANALLDELRDTIPYFAKKKSSIPYFAKKNTIPYFSLSLIHI